MLVLGKHGRHRVVVEDEHDITNIITQSAVLRLIHDNLQHLGSITRHTVGDLGLAVRRKIYTVSLDDEAKHAFVLIAEKVCVAISCVPSHVCVADPRMCHVWSGLLFSVMRRVSLVCGVVVGGVPPACERFACGGCVRENRREHFEPRHSRDSQVRCHVGLASQDCAAVHRDST